MLPDRTIPRSLARLLLTFRDCFTAPTFITFQALVIGSIAQTRRRTVCGMLLGTGLERWWHHATEVVVTSAPNVEEELVQSFLGC